MKTASLDSSCFEPDDTAIILSQHTRKRWGNAHVFICENKLKQKWLVKDCGVCNPIIRNTVGRFIFYRETRALHRLSGIKNIPGPIVTPKAYTLAYPYIPGKTLKESIRNRDNINDSFFEKLEKLVITMHQRGVAHLDIRNRRNILITPENEPIIIDFQTAIFTNRLPKTICSLLLDTDLSGIYKHWKKASNKTLTPEREKIINRMNSLRKFWIFKGYPLRKITRKITKAKK